LSREAASRSISADTLSAEICGKRVLGITLLHQQRSALLHAVALESSLGRLTCLHFDAVANGATLPRRLALADLAGKLQVE
jgi:hypothetical protein